MHYAAYGFPYARVAACLYNNWDTVWHLVFKHETIDHRNFDAASMVGFYYYIKTPKEKKEALGYYRHKNMIRDALARAIRAPMTRLLLMTRGLDMDDRNQNHDRIEIGPCGTVVSGDMYVRLARVSGLPHGHADNEMRKALDASSKRETLEALDTLARNRERSSKHSSFRCIASVQTGAPRCCHDPGDLFCDAASSVRVGYNEARDQAAVAKEQKWQVLVQLDPPKKVKELDEVEAARFLCHLMRIDADVYSAGIPERQYHYRVARNIYKNTGWTGANLARMERGTMIRKLTGLLVPEDRATRIVDKIRKYVKEDKSISLIPPCR